MNKSSGEIIKSCDNFISGCYIFILCIFCFAVGFQVGILSNDKSAIKEIYKEAEENNAGNWIINLETKEKKWVWNNDKRTETY